MSSCIQASCTRVWNRPELTMGRSWDRPEVSAEREWEQPSLSLVRKWERPAMNAGRVWERPVITFAKVCSVLTTFYLNVPMEHIWLTPDNAFSEDVAVYANVVWTIE